MIRLDSVRIVPAACLVSKGPAILAALAFLCLAGRATGKNLEVEKGGKYETLQSAIDAASAGDRIEVKAGTYRENVVVPANRTGLEIEAKGKVILDALPSGGAPAGPGIRVLAVGVVVKGLTIRNARDAGTGKPGHGLAGFAGGLRLEGLTIENCDDAGLSLEAADESRVEDCKIEACARGVEIAGDGVRVENTSCERLHSSAFVLEGDDVLVRSNEVENVGTYGVHVQGDRARILGNRVIASADEGIFVEGDDARIDGNDFRNVLDFAVRVLGDRAKVTENDVRRNFFGAFDLVGDDHEILDNALVEVDGYAIDVEGDRVRVEGNEVAFTYGTAIYLSGDAFSIRDNDLRCAFDGYQGVYVPHGTLGVVRENRIRDCSGCAVQLGDDTSAVTVEGNVADRCGGLSNPGFRIEGSSHLVAGNVAKGGGDDGFRVLGLKHVLLENVAIANRADGIDLEAGGAFEVRHNRAVKNGGEGIENNASQVVVAQNVAKKNRLDLANDGAAGVTFTDNEFETGGVATKPELE